jgi:hypothetical protein
MRKIGFVTLIVIYIFLEEIYHILQMSCNKGRLQNFIYTRTTRIFWTL